ncbi:MAG: sigma 54-interacting transcriptional regulator [Dethiobacter sp.]|nr:sigma 54-interacting transcriptional regulator [Dethiobacter sp.]
MRNFDYDSIFFYKLILENVVGVMVVDTEARIVYVNDKYANFLGIKANDVVGRRVREIVPTTRLDIIVKTGVAEYADTSIVKGKKVICNRIPLEVDGKLIGAVTMIFTEKIGDDFEFVNTLTQKLKGELEYYKREVKLLQGAKYNLNSIIGQSPANKNLKKLIKQVAATGSTVLIEGDTGTGKELVAHAIHQESDRRHHPLVRINCAAIPHELLESELFGYTEGAFTGASKKGKVGKLEIANRGSILLDEINEMPLSLQVKLLRVIQEKEIDKIGSEKPIPVDVRVISSTNQPLEDLVNKQSFREDLYYRLSVVVIKIPPLRERKEDIPLLIDHFIRKLNNTLGLNISGIDNGTVDLLLQYNWPGNARELENAIERAMNTCIKGRLDISHFSWLASRLDFVDSIGDYCLKDEIVESETKAIRNALQICKGNKTRAAKLLGINRVTLYKKLKKFSLQCYPVQK